MPGPPGGGQLAGVVDDRRPPGRPGVVGPASRRSAGPDRGGRTPAGPRAAATARVSASRSSARRGGQPGRRDLQARRTRRPAASPGRPGPGRCRLTDAQASKSGRSRASPVMPGREQRRRLVRRQVLDAQRAGQARARSGPSSSARRRAGSWSSGLTSYGGSPSRSSVQPSSRGALLRDRSASISSGGQRCWWMSIAGDGVMGFRSVMSRERVPSVNADHWADRRRSMRNCPRRSRPRSDLESLGASNRISGDHAGGLPGSAGQRQHNALATRCRSTCRRR